MLEPHNFMKNNTNDIPSKLVLLTFSIQMLQQKQNVKNFKFKLYILTYNKIITKNYDKNNIKQSL